MTAATKRSLLCSRICPLLGRSIVQPDKTFISELLNIAEVAAAAAAAAAGRGGFGKKGNEKQKQKNEDDAELKAKIGAKIIPGNYGK